MLKLVATVTVENNGLGFIVFNGNPLMVDTFKVAVEILLANVDTPVR